MSGRDLIKRFSIIIRFLEKLFKIIPDFILNIWWYIFDNSESKFALLFRYLYVNKNAKVCGQNIFIGRNVILKNIHNLELGSNISIHAYCYLDSAGGVKIGNNVSIANHTSIISFDHTWGIEDLPIKYNEVNMGEICINDDVWIGCGCRILASVKIDSRSIVAAGAVVNKYIKGNVIVGGIPAKIIKEI